MCRYDMSYTRLWIICKYQIISCRYILDHVPGASNLCEGERLTKESASIEFICFQFSKQKVLYHLFWRHKQQLILIRTLWCHSTWLRTWTSQENLKPFLHGKDSKTKSHPVRLKGVSSFWALTTTLARPPVHALGIEFHEEHVRPARVGVAIQGAWCFASHPGMANIVHLRQLVSITPHSQLMSNACLTVSGHDREIQWIRMKTTQLR